MQKPKTTPTSPPSRDDKYERSDASATYISIMAVATLVMVVVALPVVTGTNAFLKRIGPKAPELSPLALKDPAPPEPRLQVHEQVDYALLLAKQQAMMNEYRWVNKQDGVVRIPVDRAMSLLLDPTRPKPKRETPGEPAPPSSEGAPKAPPEKTPS